MQDVIENKDNWCFISLRIQSSWKIKRCTVLFVGKKNIDWWKNEENNKKEKNVTLALVKYTPTPTTTTLTTATTTISTTATPAVRTT